MALKTTLASLDDVPAEHQSLYVQQGDGFVLDIDGVDEHPDVARLKSAYERTKQDRDAIRTERDEARSKLSSVPEDFDAEAWKRVKDGKADEAQLIHLRQQLEAERDQWKSKYETAEAASLKNALDRDLTDALTASGVTDPGLVRGARAIISQSVKMVDGKPTVETDMGPLSLGEHVQRWAAGEGKVFVSQPKGGGAKGGEGGQKPLSEMGDAERLALANQGKLKAATQAA